MQNARIPCGVKIDHFLEKENDVELNCESEVDDSIKLFAMSNKRM